MFRVIAIGDAEAKKVCPVNESIQSKVLHQRPRKALWKMFVAPGASAKNDTFKAAFESLIPDYFKDLLCSGRVD